MCFPVVGKLIHAVITGIKNKNCSWPGTGLLWRCSSLHFITLDWKHLKVIIVLPIQCVTTDCEGLPYWDWTEGASMVEVPDFASTESYWTEGSLPGRAGQRTIRWEDTHSITQGQDKYLPLHLVGLSSFKTTIDYMKFCLQMHEKGRLVRSYRLNFPWNESTTTTEKEKTTEETTESTRSTRQTTNQTTDSTPKII